MPDVSYLSKLTLPVDVSGTITNVEFEIKDADARERLGQLANALYWIGVTSTELVDNVTTSATITVDDKSVTAEAGGMAQYSGEEFVYNGEKWQSVGKNNFGALAFKSSAEGSYTPAGTVSITKGTDTTASVTGIASVGTLPSATWTVSGETATFAFSAGTLPTADANPTTVITARGDDTASFSGTADTITVS